MVALFSGYRLVLASASPRRLALLRQIGLNPQVQAAQVEEIQELTDYSAPQLVMENARRKAAAVAQQYRGKDVVVIGADTVVVRDGQLFGKPADAAQARQMLLSLSANWHEVYSGLCLYDCRHQHSLLGQRRTRVHFGHLTEAECAAYVAGGEPLDKAGAYGIQGEGGLFVESIEGDYGTVVGLSLPLLRQLAAQLPDAETATPGGIL